jgi:hypothetical protein
LTFSEWARAVPESYGYLNPILTANNGWSIFISTPLGNNHFKRMLDDARTNPKWFAEVLPVQASRAISAEALEESRREYMALYGETAGQALFAQEYECSFSSVIPGAYYTAELITAEREGRVGQVDIAKRHARAHRLGFGNRRCNSCVVFPDAAGPIAPCRLLRKQPARSGPLLRVAERARLSRRRLRTPRLSGARLV